MADAADGGERERAAIFAFNFSARLIVQFPSDSSWLS